MHDNKIVEHNIVLHQHGLALNIGPVNSATLNSTTLKNAIWNSETLNQCHIK